jgi:hypothetical protein
MSLSRFAGEIAPQARVRDAFRGRIAPKSPHPALRAPSSASEGTERSFIAPRSTALAKMSLGRGRQGTAMDESSSSADAFSRVPERNTGDVLLRTAQQHHVALSSMADTKANIIITVSSIVLTLSLGRIGDASLRPAVQTLAAFTLISLFFAILAVLPKHRAPRAGADGFPSDFNLLFFGHFAHLPRERFLREVAGAMKPDGSVYETMANDLYSIGWYLAHRKYRYLRYSYLSFLAGFVLACAEQAWMLFAS